MATDKEMLEKNTKTTYGSTDTKSSNSSKNAHFNNKPSNRRRRSRKYKNQLGEHQETKIVEVPIAHEKIKHVPKKVFVEVEKRVPIIEVEWVDREVKVPQIHFQDKIVFQEHVKEIIKRVPEKKVIEVPVEKVREIPKKEVIEIVKNKVVEGDEVVIPLPYLVEERIVVPKNLYIPKATVVSQVLKVVINESKTKKIDLELNEYVPRFVEREVFLPKAINKKCGRILIPKSAEVHHRALDPACIPSPQWNALLKDQNLHIYNCDKAITPNGAEIADSFVHRAGSDTKYLSGIGSFSIPATYNDWYQHDKYERSLNYVKERNKSYIDAS